jgi:hypothetical protein
MMKGGSRWWCGVVGQLSSTRKRLTPSACLSLSSPVEDEKVRGPKGYWAGGLDRAREREVGRRMGWVWREERERWAGEGKEQPRGEGKGFLLLF